ncbi:MAG: FAD-dependent monooxygenase [Gammaproteobacteria bacterium]|nr:FAD-dependent monooxygenase [Gammaproteobacteria bacterium]
MSRLRDEAAPVAVVGAGLGGLAAAIGLLKQGFRVQVFEQAEAFGEVGAGISLSPNASKILAAWGLGDALAAMASIPRTGNILNGITGEVIQSQPLGEVLEQLFGSPYYQVLRPDLHALLVGEVRRLAPEAFHLDHRLVDIEGPDEAPVLLFANGARQAASLVIAADGSRSVVRAKRFVDEPARFTGHIAFRGVLPMEGLPERYREPRSVVWLGERRQLVHYPLNHGRALNVVAFVSDVDWDREGWHERAELSELTAQFAGFCDEATEIFGHFAGHELFKWALYDREPVDEWVRGRLVLLGDAAHPMLPYLGQGAAMAIEDAWVLAGVLGQHDEPADALADYQARRVARARWVLLESREAGRRFHEPGQDETRFSGDAAMRTRELFAPGPASLLG